MLYKKWLGVLAIVISIVIVAYVIVDQVQYSKKQSVVRVGVLVPLTGKFANYGEDIKNALELAQKDIKTKQGLDMEFFYEDSGADPKTAVPAAMKLMQVNKVSLVIGGPGSTANFAVAPLFEKERIFFMPISHAPKLVDAGNYIFKMMPEFYTEIDSMTEEIISQGKKRIAVMYDSSSDSQIDNRIYFEKIFTKRGGTIVLSEGFDSKTTTDYRASLAKIKEKNPEGLYIFAVDKDAGLLVRQAREMQIESQFYGLSALNSEEFFRAAGDAGERMIITDSFFTCEQQENQEIIDYCKKYQNSYNGRHPLYFGSRAYDALTIVSGLIKKSSLHIDTQEGKDVLMQQLLTVSRYNGVSGNMSIDEKGNALDNTYVMRVARDKKFIKK